MLNGERKMSVYAPSYFGDFVCISTKCKNSCCIDWEICIDNDTWLKYANMDDISCTVNQDDGFKSFALRKDGRCPHLNDDGLCNIILNHGEEYLSEICQKHPRFFNYINSERVEAGIGIVCEEACRIILENEKPFVLSKTEAVEAEIYETEESDFDALIQRDLIISMIEAEGEFKNKITALKLKFNLPQPYSIEDWLKRYLSLEILDEKWEKDLKDMKHKSLQKNKELLSVFGKYYERLLTYFVYRHVSVAASEENLRARLAFCILSVEIIGLLFEENLANPVIKAGKAPEKLIDWARRYSAEIEYSEDNTDELIFAFESGIYSM